MKNIESKSFWKEFRKKLAISEKGDVIEVGDVDKNIYNQIREFILKNYCGSQVKRECINSQSGAKRYYVHIINNGVLANA